MLLEVLTEGSRMNDKKEVVQAGDLNRCLRRTLDCTPFTDKPVTVRALKRHSFFNMTLPLRYSVDKDGVCLNIGKRAQVIWINISRTPCTILNIDLSKDDVGFDCIVVFMTATGAAMTTKINQKFLLTKEIQHLITIMQKEGAICTANDAKRLNVYFKECLNELIKRGC